MNKRIEELVKQATTPPIRIQGYAGESTQIYPGSLDVEKFAQLIIEKCLEFSEPMPGSGDIDDLAGVQAQIKEYFGIE